MTLRVRDFSVHAVSIAGEPDSAYAKVRALEGVIAPGRRVEIQRPRESSWHQATVVEAPADNTLGSIVFVTLSQ